MSLRARVSGSDVAAADSGHGRPPLAAEDRLRLVAGVLRAVPALWSALHWPPILPVSGVSAGLHRLYTDSILYSDRFFYRLALCSVQRTLDTGHRPGSELGMSTDNTQAETPDAVLSPATLTKHHLIYYHIMFSVPCLFLMC